MLVFSPGFPLFLKSMEHPITALKRCITSYLLPRNRSKFRNLQTPPSLPQPRILRHRMYPWDLPRQPTSRLLNRNQRLLGPYWIVSWTFPLPYVMTITTAHLLVLSSGLPDPVLGTTAPLVKLSSLLNYLNQHLTPHLRSHIGTSTQSCFVTLIIGPSTDVRVGAALHSHLVCAAVAPSNEDYSVLFIPSDLLTDFACPIEWQPLFLYFSGLFSLSRPPISCHYPRLHGRRHLHRSRTPQPVKQ